MYKQVIVVNKGLNMSPEKLGVMVAHGSGAYFYEWFKRNVNTLSKVCEYYQVNSTALIDQELYDEWIVGDFIKVILEVKNHEEMKTVIRAALNHGFENNRDLFCIPDEATEFLGEPQWAVIAFKPMYAEDIDYVTGGLKVYTTNESQEDIEQEDEDMPDIYRMTYYRTYAGVPKLETNVFMLVDYTLESITYVRSKPLKKKYRLVNLTKKSGTMDIFNSKRDAVNYLIRCRGFVRIEEVTTDKISILS